METNALPYFDTSDNPTACCPRFKPQGWDGQDLHFVDKPFVSAKTHSVFHVPLDMGAVIAKAYARIREAGAIDEAHFVLLSRDLSPWSAEHLFAVEKDVPGAEMVRLTGDYRTKVFEGPYRKVPQWFEELQAEVRGRGEEMETAYFFYTTCPKCAKAYGKNYVVGVAKIAP
jgi:hypothetical protein